jgi:hypothetical protein
MLEAADQTMIPAELRSIGLASIYGRDEELPPLRRGASVRLFRGTLVGHRGNVSCRKSNVRIVLPSTLSQPAVAVEVDVHDVQAIATTRNGVQRSLWT